MCLFVKVNSFTLHITFYDLAALAAIFIALAFALLLGFTKSINSAANRLFALALITVTLALAGLLGLDTGVAARFPVWSRLFLECSLATGPMIYFGVLKINRRNCKLNWQDVLHLIPLPVLFTLSWYIKKNVGWLPTLLLTSVFISVAVYLSLAHRLIPRFQKDPRDSLTDKRRHELWRLRRLLVRFGVLWLLFAPFIVTTCFSQRNLAIAHLWFAVYLLLALISVRLAAVVFSWPLAAMPVQAQASLKPSTSSELAQKGAWLKAAMKASRYYQDAELGLSSLAEKLDIPPHELSRIINTSLKKNFNDFINEYRVRDVIIKMQDVAYDRITLLGIAYESGFNSQRSFNRVFKEITGKTPAEYKNSLKKELPNDKLATLPRIRPVILRLESPPTWASEKLNRSYMFRNYLKIAWRNLVKNKVYSALNITGLATGMAVALLIGLWVVNQYSYDRFLPNYSRLYQVKFNFTDPKEGTHTQPAVCIPLANVLRTTIPGIRRVAETDWVGYNVRDLKVGDKKILVNAGNVNPEFLKIFRYPFIKGDRNNALANVYSIVINESTAKALFGNADPMYKTIRVDNQHDAKVTGVFKDIPATASLKFGCLQPFSYKELTEPWTKDAPAQWTNNSFEMFVELQAGVTQAKIAPQIKGLIVKYHPDYKNVKGEVILQPIKDQHLYSDYENGKVAGGFIDYVRMFSVIGALVLLIACINFMNLSTARSEKRAREVGVRKAIGSQRKDLIFQFLTESLMITFAAFLLSVLLVQLALDPFNELAGSSIKIPYNDAVFWAGMIGYVLFTGLMAGSRPAFYLSSFSAVKVLKGTIQAGKAASLPRKILVIAQFTCSIALIISTVIIYEQIQYSKDRPAGYSADGLVSTFMGDDLMRNYEALKNDLLQTRMVKSVTKASSPLTDIFWHTGIDKWPGKEGGDLGINTAGVSVADNYFKTVGMKLVAGHDFSPDWRDDTLNVIVNEAAVKRMGLKQPLNQLINYGGLTYPVRIIGVVQDALIESPYTAVEPTVFNHGRGPNVMIYRLASGVNPHDAMAKIGKLFDKYNPAYPFDYVFVDQAYDQKFGLEELIGKLAGIFAALAIFISCLGLFGLAAYMAEQRTKEIGIRKVLGASIGQVWLMLSRDFVVLVTISCLIASPLALYFLHPWLNKYPYHIHIGPGVFLLSAVAALIITLLTISFQAIRAAVTNPVNSLRSE